MYFVPMGQHDRSQARSAWESVPQKNRPVGYGMMGTLIQQARRLLPLPRRHASLRSSALGVSYLLEISKLQGKAGRFTLLTVGWPSQLAPADTSSSRSKARRFTPRAK
jgi:hypothetical protein